MMSATRTHIGAVMHADDDTFAEKLDDTRAVVAYFWAEWCPPCRAIGPVLEELAAEHRILAVPTLKVFVDGEVVCTIVGAKPKAALEFELGPYLAR